MPMGQNTLEDVARLFGCTASQLSRYERGKRPVPAQKVSSIAAITGIPRQTLRPDIFDSEPEAQAS